MWPSVLSHILLHQIEPVILNILKIRDILHGSDKRFVIEGPYPFIILLSMICWVVVRHKQHPFYSQEELLHGLCNTVPIDPMGSYSSVLYKAIDGWRMKIYLEPMESDLTDVADSNGNLKMRFI